MPASTMLASRSAAWHGGGRVFDRDPAAIDKIVIINDFMNAQGGATAVALLEAGELRRQGYAVTFIGGDSPSDDLERLGVAQVSLRMSGLLDQPPWRAMTSGIHNGAASRMIGKWIERNDTARTVYHLHNWSQILSPAVFEALQPVSPRLVVTCHDFFNICPNGGFTHYAGSRPCAARPLSAQCMASQCDRRSPAQKYWRALRHLRLNDVARFRHTKATFTFLHDRMRDRFVEGGFAGKDLRTISNPVEAWTDHRIEAESNHEFLFVGRVGRDKGADLAIRAANAAGQTLTLVGTGEIDPASYRDSGNIRFEGWCDRDRIAQIASKARALIVPSRVVEPFGLVVLEAAMSGLPVIVSSHAYLADDVKALGFGQSFAIEQEGDLAKVIASLAVDDTKIARMSRAGFDRAHGLCNSPRRWVEQVVGILQSKIDGVSAPASLQLRKSGHD